MILDHVPFHSSHWMILTTIREKKSTVTKLFTRHFRPLVSSSRAGKAEKKFRYLNFFLEKYRKCFIQSLRAFRRASSKWVLWAVDLSVVVSTFKVVAFLRNEHIDFQVWARVRVRVCVAVCARACWPSNGYFSLVLRWKTCIADPEMAVFPRFCSEN